MDRKFKELFLEKINKEISKRTQKRKGFEKTLLKEWERKVSKYFLRNKFETKKINSTFNFCKKLNYKHGNKIDKAYFSHLLRLGCMSLFIKKDIDYNLTRLAFVHNILETGNFKKKSKISKQFGGKIFQQIKILTVNRKIQWDKKYKKQYYEKIKKSHVNVKIIKILDKMDNLFLLSKNKDLNIKKKYINEIKTYVLPMVKVTLPDIFKYFNNLVIYNYKKIQNEKNL